MSEGKKSSIYKTVLAFIVCILMCFGAGVIAGRAIVLSHKRTLALEEKNRRKELLNHKIKQAKLSEENNKREKFQKHLAYAILELQPKVGPEMANMLSSYIINESEENELDPILITALIYTESKFDILAHNRTGAVGLMQVRYLIWKETPILKDNGISAKYKLFWPRLNIKCGTKILSKYYKESKHNIVKTLYRYNTGTRDIPKGKKAIEISYINKIMLTAYKISELIKTKENLINEEVQINENVGNGS